MTQANRRSPRSAQRLDMSDLYRFKPWIFARDLLIDWALIVTAFVALAHSPSIPVIILAWLTIGSRQHALAVLGHEGAHGRISANRRLNDIVGAIAGFWPLGSGLRTYKAFHLAHHRNLGSERDPELEHKRRFNPHYDLPMTRSKLVKQAIKDIFGLAAPYVSRVGFAMRPVTRFDYIGAGAFWAAIVGTVAFFNMWWILAWWFGCLVTSFWLFFHTRIWFEHMGARDTWRLRIPVLFRLIAMPHNIGIHYEHHRWPFIPYMNLLEAREREKTQPIIDWWVYLRLLSKMPRLASGEASSYFSLELHPELEQTDHLFPPQHSSPRDRDLLVLER